MKLFTVSRSVAKLDYTTVRLPFTLLEECVISEMYSVLGEAADRRGDRIASFHIDAASTSAFTGSYREPVPARLNGGAGPATGPGSRQVRHEAKGQA